MSIWMKRLVFLIAAALLSLAAQRHAFAGSAMWSANPISNNWNTAQNWIPASVPNAPSDTAGFGRSNVTLLTITTSVEVSSINFNPGAPTFAINVEGVGINLFVSGAGIINGSGVRQSFMADGGQSGIFFQNAASAGNLVSFGGDAPQFFFTESASAGSASFEVISNDSTQSHLFFFDNSKAAEATITASDFADLGVFDNATGGNAVFTLTTGAFLSFGDDATADHAVGTCIGGNGIYGSNISFSQFATAAQGNFTAVGGTASGEAGSFIQFSGSATAADGSFVIQGGTARDLAGAQLTFVDTSTAANATITANGGVSGAEGGAILFEDRSKGGNASISLLGNGELEISNRAAPGVTIGSLAGNGLVFLGARTLTIGSNNLSTSFSGLIEDSGGLTKTGTGTLTLSGANTYTGATTVSAGVLKGCNKTGSATGTGSVNVSAGTLGGKGIIAGATTVGTGSGAGAFLAPSVGSNKPTKLTIQNLLTFKSNGTYSYQLNTTKAKADQVVANGVIIQSGAQFSFGAVGDKRLQRGQVFTAISNTSASPISGAFANLADGSTLTAGRNRFQVSYSGGDGNDLTLTVAR